MATTFINSQSFFEHKYLFVFLVIWLKSINFFCFINLLYQIIIYVLIRKQPPEVFWQGGVLGNFVGFAGRCLCWGQPKACNSVDRETGCRCSHVGFVRFLRVPFLQSTSRQLLLLIPLSYPFLTL